MNSNGNIFRLMEEAGALSTVDEVRYRGLEPIPDEELADVMAMPRRMRRDWFRAKRREQKKKAKAKP